MKINAISIWAMLAVAILGGASFVMLSNSPFGLLFWGSLYVCVAGLLAAIFILSLRWFISTTKWRRVASVIAGCFALAGLALATITIIDYRLFFWRDISGRVSKTQWQEDLKFLADEIPRRHSDFYSIIPHSDFEAKVSALQQSLPELTDHQIIAEFMKLVALLDEGHSEILPIMPPANFRLYPLKIYFFIDGWHIVDAAREYKHVIGSRLVKIGKMGIEEVFATCKTMIGAENELHEKFRFSILGMTAELLVAEGILENAEKGEFLLENERGEQYEIELKPQPSLAWVYWAALRSVNNENSPAIDNRRKNNYWFEFREDAQAIYFQFNEVRNQSSGETLATFAQRLNDFANAQEFDRFVIDLRNNTGGDNTLLAPLIDVISKNEKINRRGKLFTIIGRKTYSAAANFAGMIENRTKTIFIGEPTGSGPNHFGEPRRFVLPKSKLEMSISSKFWQSSISEDRRSGIEPDIAVAYSHEDYLNHSDPEMAALLAYQFNEPATLSLNEKQLEKYVGRYVFSSCQILSIQRKENKLAFTLTDFVPGSFTKVQSDLHPLSESEFLTDISTTTLSSYLGC